MSFLSAPLAQRTARPVGVAAVWAWVAATAALVVAAVVGLVGAIVSVIGVVFSDGTFSIPWQWVRGVGAALTPFVLGASTWAAANTSGDRHAALRGVIGTAVGLLVGVPLALLGAITSAVAGFGVAWSLAVPFETWLRPAIRIAAVALVVGVGWSFGAQPFWTAVGVVVVSPAIAAIAFLAGDWTWKGLRPKRR